MSSHVDDKTVALKILMVIKERIGMRIMLKRVLKEGIAITCWLLVKILGRWAFDKKYLKGRWFTNITSIGWRIAFKGIFIQKVFGINRHVPWPVSSKILIVNPMNIIFHPDDLNNFQGGGNYFQAIGKITIGKGTYIAPNVGIITANHTIGDLDEHDDAEPVFIGNNCWIGMNSVILPGVELGDGTVVGAGAVVTKSFPEGNMIIAGNPAKVIRKL